MSVLFVCSLNYAACKAHARNISSSVTCPALYDKTLYWLSKEQDRLGTLDATDGPIKGVI